MTRQSPGLGTTGAEPGLAPAPAKRAGECTAGPSDAPTPWQPESLFQGVALGGDERQKGHSCVRSREERVLHVHFGGRNDHEERGRV